MDFILAWSCATLESVHVGANLGEVSLFCACAWERMLHWVTVAFVQSQLFLVTWTKFQREFSCDASQTGWWWGSWTMVTGKLHLQSSLHLGRKIVFCLRVSFAVRSNQTKVLARKARNANCHGTNHLILHMWTTSVQIPPAIWPAISGGCCALSGRGFQAPWEREGGGYLALGDQSGGHWSTQ